MLFFFLIIFFQTLTLFVELYLEMEFNAVNFYITCLMHPSTYLNKILLCSRQGQMQLWNIKTKYVYIIIYFFFFLIIIVNNLIKQKMLKFLAKGQRIESHLSKLGFSSRPFKGRMWSLEDTSLGVTTGRCIVTVFLLSLLPHPPPHPHLQDACSFSCNIIIFRFDSYLPLLNK